MRPLGHNAARGERDASILPPDDALEEAWREYQNIRGYILVSWDAYWEFASDALHSADVSLRSIERFLVLHQRADPILGIFLSACYQKVPEKTIVYGPQCPRVDFLGYRLQGKHLIIDRDVGICTGAYLLGDLTINGSAGMNAGFMMVGTLTVSGNVSGHFGQGLIGAFADRRPASFHSSLPQTVLGFDDGTWRSGGLERITRLYGVDGRRERFLRDIAQAQESPDDIHTVREQLRARYRGML
jgi:hypothetical protein